jgi:hypothetical protein
MAHPQVADGGDSFHMWRVAANVLSSDDRQLTGVCPAAWGLDRGSQFFTCKKLAGYRILHRSSDLDGFLNMTWGAENGHEIWTKFPGKRPLGRCRWEDNIRMDLRDIRWEDADWFHLTQDGD